MKTLLVSCAQVCLVAICIATCLAESQEPKRSKLYEALSPALVTGRHMASRWGSNTDDKRWGASRIVSFPRVGRSDTIMIPKDSYGAKRPGSTSGLWFGPRLGRVQKRSDEYLPLSYVILNEDNPSMSKPIRYVPHIARDFSDDVSENMESDDVFMH